MDVENLKQVIVNALEDLKGRDIVSLDVRGISGVTDYMIVCSGTSNRHVKSLANNVWIDAKQAGYSPIGMEGERAGDWILVDFADVVVHVMLPEARQFYDLERLWSVPGAHSDQAETADSEAPSGAGSDENNSADSKGDTAPSDEQG